MESVVSLASLEFDEAVAKVASNEDETKSLEQSVTSSVTAMTALVKKVKEAAADVKKIIEKKSNRTKSKLRRSRRNRRSKTKRKSKNIKTRLQAQRPKQGGKPTHS